MGQAATHLAVEMNTRRHLATRNTRTHTDIYTQTHTQRSQAQLPPSLIAPSLSLSFSLYIYLSSCLPSAGRSSSWLSRSVISTRIAPPACRVRSMISALTCLLLIPISSSSSSHRRLKKKNKSKKEKKNRKKKTKKEEDEERSSRSRGGKDRKK